MKRSVPSILCITGTCIHCSRLLCGWRHAELMLHQPHSLTHLSRASDIVLYLHLHSLSAHRFTHPHFGLSTSSSLLCSQRAHLRRSLNRLVADRN